MEPVEQLKRMSNRLSHSINAEEAKSQTLHLQTDCPDCGGSGWIWSRDDNGIPYCEECHCGIRKKMIMQNQLYQLPESKEIFIQAAKAVKYWIENIQQMQEQGIGLYIYSNTKGSGKTRLVCSMANEMIEKHQKSVKFTTSLKILDEIKSTWGERGKNAENKLISDLTYADILIIDDFGAESGKDWINEKFYRIINGRYVDKKTTIFTSNYPISRLKYDDRITNRILERSLEIPFPEESVREHIADAMKQELIKKIQGGENGKQA